jgi:hypothetical protein
MAKRRTPWVNVSTDPKDAIEERKPRSRSRSVPIVEPARVNTMRKSEPYRPQDARDVTAEMLAFSGRGRNGRPSGVDETMRRQLPRPPFPPSGEALEVALRQQEESERARSDAQTREAERRYRAGLAEIARRRGQPVDVPVEVLDDDNLQEEIQENESQEDKVKRLYAEAAEAARMLRERGAAPASPTGPASVPLPVSAGASPHPARTPPPPVPTADVIARSVTAIDIDRLWDWIRANVEEGQAFLGRQFQTSLDLHHFIGDMSQSGEGRALDVEGHHVGFFALHPIDRVHNTAMLHFYLSLAVRGQFARLFPYILSGARQIIPPTMHLAVVAPAHAPDVMNRLLRPFNFVQHTIFLQYGAPRG